MQMHNSYLHSNDVTHAKQNVATMRLHITITANSLQNMKSKSPSFEYSIHSRLSITMSKVDSLGIFKSQKVSKWDCLVSP